MPENILKKIDRKKIIFLFVLIYCLRLPYLDADVKTFSVAQVQPMDELYYNEIAVKIHDFGIGALINRECADPSVANAKTFLFSNLVTGAFMSMFGKNFWAMKFPYFLMGLLNGILLLLSAEILIPNKKKTHLAIMMAYVLDFNVFMLSREAVTVMPCMLACILYFYVLLKIDKAWLKWSFAGFFPAIALTMVYMGLPFLMPVGLTLLFIECFWQKESRVINICAYILGNVIGIGISECVSRILFHQHVLKTILDTMSAHGSKLSGIHVFGSVRGCIANAVSYWTSNVYRYNYVMLIFSVATFLLLIYGIIKKKDKTSFTLFIFILIHWAQTFFLNNMTPSKATITYPIMLLSIGYVYDRWMIDLIKSEGKSRKMWGMICIIALIGSIGLFKMAGHPVITAFKVCLYVILCLTIVAIAISFLKRNYSTLIVPIALSAVVLPTMSIYYTYYQPTFIDKEMMIDLGEVTSDGFLLNGAGFNLYNSCRALTSIYDHYKGEEYNYDTMYAEMIQACYDYEDLYYIGDSDEASEWNVAHLNELLKDTPFIFKEVKQYPRAFYIHDVGSHDSDQTLWKKTNR